ncbi:sulfite exporter TauE/SafE family protein [Motiliproteus sp. MSK22-1]|uniref:sulfite exporter TauE/SafE family protein n=1 Tax=Motiliproteus sp. MSK22-1 TaxID=1897630 RepID=UPI000977C750|nr:sulfite exporter TauE/SafE family protein [Motiliproteus sp. MSK22-1]OMH39113.1 permease [Motiliproteus sp. MSK22-1]
MEISFFSAILLVFVGLIAGGINTLAGGGSNLTLPVLMTLGMSPEIANATNRVGVALQSVAGALGFRANDKLPSEDIGPILLPTLVGGLAGAVAASFAPSWVLKPLLLGSMLTMALIILVRPSVVCPPAGTPSYRVAERPSSWWWLGIAGFYGGFVQAGVGFILLGALAGTLRYDLVRANALKLVCSLAFTVVALMVFVVRDQVLWLPGLILASGTIIGARLAVKFALVAKQQTLKWFLFVMTLCGCIAALTF